MAYDVLVIGAGQAGLAMGYQLSQRGKDFLLLDGATDIGDSWRWRWDSLRLFTSARHSALPGLPFPGAGARYPGKDEVSDYFGRYAERFDLPVQLGARVRRLGRSRAGGAFEAETEGQMYQARQVVLATGPFQRPAIPAIALDVPSLHTAEYRNPRQLPDGPVVVVGGGNSGVQIAEELAATPPVPGLFHLGLPFLRSRGSALIGWVGNDAAYLREQLTSG